MVAGPADQAAAVAAAAAPFHHNRHSPPVAPIIVPDSFAKDAILAWFRGEFAAANAIIDALCAHLAHLSSVSGDSSYDAVFAAVHRRRLNWIPVLQMQKYHTIADVALELRKVSDRKTVALENGGAIADGGGGEIADGCVEDEKEKKMEEKVTRSEEIGGDDSGEGGENNEEYDSPESEITDLGMFKRAFGCVLNFTFEEKSDYSSSIVSYVKYGTPIE